MFKIAVASGKGGTGKTFLSTHIFHALREAGMKAGLADCDAEAPNAAVFFELKQETETPVIQEIPVIDDKACTFCGLCHEYCNYGAIFYLPENRMIRVLDDLCHSCGACQVACRHGAITVKEVEAGRVTQFSNSDGARVTEAKMRIGAMTPVPVIRESIKTAITREETISTSGGNGGILILDAPPGTSCPFVHATASADFVILVTEPTPFGLSDLRQSVETLRTIGKPFGVVINRAGIGNDAVAEYLKTEEIPLMMEIPFDREVAGNYSRGMLSYKHNGLLGNGLVNMVSNILADYGNSDSKR